MPTMPTFLPIVIFGLDVLNWPMTKVGNKAYLRVCKSDLSGSCRILFSPIWSLNFREPDHYICRLSLELVQGVPLFIPAILNSLDQILIICYELFKDFRTSFIKPFFIDKHYFIIWNILCTQSFTLLMRIIVCSYHGFFSFFHYHH